MAKEHKHTPPTAEDWIKSGHKKISKAICLIQSARELDLTFAFDRKPDWNNEVLDDIDKALKYLAYADATFNLWDEDLKEGE